MMSHDVTVLFPLSDCTRVKRVKKEGCRGVRVQCVIH